jgi:hypothetical protein
MVAVTAMLAADDHASVSYYREGEEHGLMQPSLIYSGASNHSKRSLKGGMMGHEIQNTHSSCWSC